MKLLKLLVKIKELQLCRKDFDPKKKLAIDFNDVEAPVPNGNHKIWALQYIKYFEIKCDVQLLTLNQC